MTNKIETKNKMYEEIEKHGQNLNNIFHTKYGNIELCKKLFRLEQKAHKLATDYCNGENGVDSDNWNSKCEPILKSLQNILSYKRMNNMRDDSVPVYVNGDARGYALKIHSSWLEERQYIRIYKDMGGFGIIAPDFREVA